jgi:hypothetical protein
MHYLSEIVTFTAFCTAAVLIVWLVFNYLSKDKKQRYSLIERR